MILFVDGVSLFLDKVQLYFLRDYLLSKYLLTFAFKNLNLNEYYSIYYSFIVRCLLCRIVSPVPFVYSAVVGGLLL